MSIDVGRREGRTGLQDLYGRSGVLDSLAPILLAGFFAFYNSCESNRNPAAETDMLQ